MGSIEFEGYNQDGAAFQAAEEELSLETEQSAAEKEEAPGLLARKLSGGKFPWEMTPAERAESAQRGRKIREVWGSSNEKYFLNEWQALFDGRKILLLGNRNEDMEAEKEFPNHPQIAKIEYVNYTLFYLKERRDEVMPNVRLFDIAQKLANNLQEPDLNHLGEFLRSLALGYTIDDYNRFIKEGIHQEETDFYEMKAAAAKTADLLGVDSDWRSEKPVSNN